MKIFTRLAFFFLAFGFINVSAQEIKQALPEYDLQILGKEKVRISWVNPFGADLIQVNVQRSYDSVRGYKTVFSAQSPELPENGFVETYYPGVKVYYRIFYMLSSNAYFFTKAKLASPSVLSDSVAAQLAATNDTVTVKSFDSIVTRLPYNQFLRFKDSVFTQTKDTLLSLSSDTILLKPYVYNGAWRASVYFFTDRTGVVNLKVPDAKAKVCSLKVFDADTQEPVFTIKHIPDADLIISKSNFLHAGWFLFELYEDNKLKERNKLFIQKEF